MPGFVSSGAAYLVLVMVCVMGFMVVGEIVLNVIFERSKGFRRWYHKACGHKAVAKSH